MHIRKYSIIENSAAHEALQRLEARNDFKDLRMKKLLGLPDLTRKEGSPLKFVADAVLALPRFSQFDLITIPEVVMVRDNFDLLNTPLDHPSRQETDTYYLEDNWILRTHTTVMWPYYLSEETKQRLQEEGEVGALSYGKVYRKDEIDRSHYPVFHQIDGLYICKKEKSIVGIPELTEVLVDIAKTIYGPSVAYRVSEDAFPFTHPSIEVTIQWGSEWLEVLGAGVVHTEVLKNLGVDPERYNGWAFGFGLERLAMIKMAVPDIRIFWSNDSRITSQFQSLESTYEEVSKYPMTYRDISFVVEKTQNLNAYYEIVRDCAGDLVEEMKLLDRYENAEKFGEGKVSYTYRTVYRSHERTLTNEEINRIHAQIEARTKEMFQATVR